MRPVQRQSEILRVVRLRRACRIEELAEQLAVSAETVRRDVRRLAAEGLVLKLHGEVGLPEPLGEPPFQRRMMENRDAKQRIASRVAELVQDGDALMLDTGSTTAYVALALAGHSHLLVVTNSTEIARILATRNGNRVFMAGGELRADDAAAFGVQAQAFIRQFEVQHAILSIGGIGDNGSFMDFHIGEAEISQAIIGQAERVIVVADHGKFGRRGFVRVCGPEQVDLLISDRAAPSPLAECLVAAGVDVLTA